LCVKGNIFVKNLEKFAFRILQAHPIYHKIVRNRGNANSARANTVGKTIQVRGGIVSNAKRNSSNPGEVNC
jgi:hypothetical protein